MSSVQFLSKVTYEMTNGSGPLCPLFHVSLFVERVDIFLSAWRSESTGAIAMDTECPFGVQF